MRSLWTSTTARYARESVSKPPPKESASPKTSSDFCFLNGRSDSRLSDVERLTMLGGGGLDRILQRLGKTLEGVNLDAFSTGLEPSVLRASQERLHTLRTQGAIAELFRPIGPPRPPAVVPVHGFPFGSVIDLEFRSEFPAASWGHDPSYQAVESNRNSYVRLWEHNDDHEGRATIVAIHGWTMGDQRVNSLAFMPGLLYTLGCNVALVELPFHGRRRPVGVPESDPLFPSIDPVRTCVAMAHALHDLRALAAFLSSRGHSRLSCVGMSLGAYVAALWASVDVLRRVALLVPLVSMGDMAHELLVKRFGSSEGAAIGVDVAVLRDLFSDHYPLSRDPQTAQESIMVVRGKGDQLVSRGQIAILRRAWPRAKYLWADGGHGAPVKRGETFARMTDFLLEKGE